MTVNHANDESVSCLVVKNEETDPSPVFERTDPGRICECDMDFSDTYGETPLTIAVKEDRAECVKELIKEGADVNFSDKYGQTPLVCAVKNNRVKCFERTDQSRR